MVFVIAQFFCFVVSISVAVLSPNNENQDHNEIKIYFM